LSNTAIPVALLRKLASDHDSAVRVEVAANRRTPPGVLCELAQDKPAARLAVARNPSAPPDALYCLADPNNSVAIRQEVLRNPSVSGGTLSLLARDRKRSIRETARRRLAKLLNHALFIYARDHTAK